MMTNEIFQRSHLLLGGNIMQQLAVKKVIVFGIGGVGSWCAESLVRTGISNITIVDTDRISITNINRQLHATTHTVGEVKTEVLKKRLLEINPQANVIDLRKVYSAETYHEFELDNYDYIIDAIDSLQNKIHLIQTATKTNAEFYSSMGAALKVDARRIKVDEFWNVNYCPLARRIRRLIKKGELPAKKFLCVYSDEIMQNNGESEVDTENSNYDDALNDNIENWNEKKAVINGSLSHITASFGFMLAGLVIQDIYEKYKNL